MLLLLLSFFSEVFVQGNREYLCFFVFLLRAV